MKLVISSATCLKSKPENPDLLKEDQKVFFEVGQWLEVEKACEYPMGHYQIVWEGQTWYCRKINSFLED